MLNEQEQAEILRVYQESGTFIEGTHVVLSAGDVQNKRHSDRYFQKGRVTRYPRHLKESICRIAAEQIRGRGVRGIVSPARGAIPLAYWTARALSELDDSPAFAVYTEKPDAETSYAIKREFGREIAGKQVLVLSDGLVPMFGDDRLPQIEQEVERCGTSACEIDALEISLAPDDVRRLFMHPHELGRACDGAFSQFRVDAVIAPANLGIIIAQEVAYQAYELYHRDVLAMFAERETQANAEFALDPIFAEAVRGQPVAVFEDVMTSGASTKGSVDVLRREGADVVAVISLLNRGGITADQLDVPEVISLLDRRIDSWAREECPMCRQGMPVRTDIGHGAKYVEAYGQLAKPI